MESRLASCEVCIRIARVHFDTFFKVLQGVFILSEAFMRYGEKDIGLGGDLVEALSLITGLEGSVLDV
jgi:hypothetical protein